MRTAGLRIAGWNKVVDFGVGAMLLAGVTGCAEMKISESEIDRLANALATQLPLSVCEGKAGTPKNKTIDILFVNISQGENEIWCPKRQVEECPQTYDGKTVSWRSVAENEQGETIPVNADFTVYFAPFPSGSVGSGGNGIAGPRSLSAGAPAGLYKYTVAPADITDDCPVVDPNWWVNKR